LGIATSRAGSADGTVGRELALRGTTILVGRVANRARLEFTGSGVTTVVVAAAACASAITIFACLDNAIAALAASNSDHIPVIGQTCRFYTVPAHGGADIPYGTSRELADATSRGRIHDELSVGIAGRRGERATLLLRNCSVRTTGTYTIVHGAKGMTTFMGEHLPLSRSPHNYISASRGLVVVGGASLRAKLTKPRQAHCSVGVTGAQQGPVCIGVVELPSPGGEQVETISDCDAVATGSVPQSS
jgi:hypothetical protein